MSGEATGETEIGRQETRGDAGERDAGGGRRWRCGRRGRRQETAQEQGKAPGDRERGGRDCNRICARRHGRLPGDVAGDKVATGDVSGNPAGHRQSCQLEAQDQLFCQTAGDWRMLRTIPTTAWLRGLFAQGRPRISAPGSCCSYISRTEVYPRPQLLTDISGTSTCRLTSGATPWPHGTSVVVVVVFPVKSSVF